MDAVSFWKLSITGETNKVKIFILPNTLRSDSCLLLLYINAAGHFPFIQRGEMGSETAANKINKYLFNYFK